MTKFKVGDKVQAVGTKVQGVITKVISKGYYHVFFGESSGTYQVNEDSIEVYEGDLEAVKNQTFTKKDIKTGMAVRLRNGDIGHVLLDTPLGDIIRHMQDGTWSRLANYTSDLLRSGAFVRSPTPYDIMEVFSPKYACTLLGTELATVDYSIWTRTEIPVRRVSVSELEKELGCKLNIVANEEREED